MKNKNFFKSVSCAISGISDVLKSERNFRIDIIAFAAVIVFSFIFSLDRWEKCVVFSLCGLVLSMEAVNSSIERALDALHPSFSPLVGRAKDASAAAVLIASLFALFIGLYIFIPHGIDFLRSVFNG
jgi:diacylglycerol kinase